MLPRAEKLPVAPDTEIHRGDMMNIHGPEPAVSHVGALDGNVARSTLSTNFVALGLAIFASALLGLALTSPVGGRRIVLGS
jgi:uncharacterized transporter YbjL